MKSILSATIAVVGLGYVGLPLAVAFGRKLRTIGYDLSEKKIAHFKNHTDPTGEVTTEQFQQALHLTVTSNASRLREADIVIVAVPTPIDECRRPDLGPVKSATATVGSNLKEGAVVVFESTVYPGLTEEVCVPILEQESGLHWKRDFHVGYSPERINPGDKEHTLERIVKVVSGDDEDTLHVVAAVYEQIVDAGVYRARSIKEAEAAKVIENTQRDLNIALVNELAVIFDRLGIDTTRVLEAAGTKWNFLPFRPGLVGGHCIGVDPYYLTHKAETVGYHPEVILAGRRINDGMGKFIAEKTVKMMIQSGLNGKGARVGVFGLTFKEDCPDLRNSRVVDIIRELESYGMEVLVHDSMADATEAEEHYGIRLQPWETMKDLSAIILAVAHSAYCQHPADEYVRRLAPNGFLIDVKSILYPEEVRNSGTPFWRL
jgi:UDP-N-acetyl-D-glucosamine/UDP-N-acetyl-D-galactosamine dehydrogenase